LGSAAGDEAQISPIDTDRGDGKRGGAGFVFPGHRQPQSRQIEGQNQGGVGGEGDSGGGDCDGERLAAYGSRDLSAEDQFRAVDRSASRTGHAEAIMQKAARQDAREPLQDRPKRRKRKRDRSEADGGLGEGPAFPRGEQFQFQTV